MWMSQKHLAGYTQQDAHEFFISVLNEMHRNFCGILSPNIGKESGCKCIIHEAFGGILQSDVICLQCKSVSTVFDPFLDISIDITSAIRKTTNTSNGHSHAGGAYTLHECLDGYTAPEQLRQYYCKNCNTSNVKLFVILGCNQAAHI